MPIYAKAGSATSYAPASAGAHAALCVDVVDLGMLTVAYNGKEKTQHKVNIIWQIDEERDDGKRFELRKRYTLSLHEKSSLRRDLESWRGKQFTPEELEGFDLEALIGIPCLINVMHAPGKDGGTFANVSTIMRLPKGMPAPIQNGYVRVCDRQASQESQAMPPDIGITDDDIPF